MFDLKISIPTPLRRLTEGNAVVEVSGATVGSALTILLARYPSLKQQLYTEDGRLRSFVNLYLNDEDVRYLDRENTPVKTGDVLSIIPSIAGGRSGAEHSSGATAVAEPPLSNDEILRYSRHLIMPEVGMEGQQRLKQAKVLCIGAGGLGSPLALYLAAAGVGTLGIVEDRKSVV